MDPKFRPGVDLNLLLVLDTLLQTRHVSRAAAELNLSQPAVSNALRRLRLYFGDELLTRRGNRFELTPLAQQLSFRTPAALDNALRIFDANATFVPAESRREFSVIMSDYGSAVIGPPLARLLGEQAPNSRLRIIQVTQENVDNRAVTLRTVDGVILPHGYTPGFPYLDLFEERWVCLLDQHNTEVGEAATVESLRSLPRVALMEGVTAFSPADRQLRLMGVDPHIDVVVDSFLSVPHFIRGTRRFALLPERLLEVANLDGVRWVPAPDGIGATTMALWWDPSHENDPGHHWFRSLLQQATARP